MLEPHGLFLFTREGFINIRLMISLRSIELQPQKGNKNGRHCKKFSKNQFDSLKSRNSLLPLCGTPFTLFTTAPKKTARIFYENQLDFFHENFLRWKGSL